MGGIEATTPRRKLFIFALLANVALTVVSYMVSPDRIATHFNFYGTADSWGPKETILMAFLPVELLVFFISFVAPPLIFKFPPEIFNLPNKDYWLKKENLPRVREKFSILMAEFGIALLAFFSLVGLLVLDANLAHPIRLNEGIFLSGLIAFLLYTVYWIVKLFRSFRIPQNAKIR